MTAGDAERAKIGDGKGQRNLLKLRKVYCKKDEATT